MPKGSRGGEKRSKNYKGTIATIKDIEGFIKDASLLDRGDLQGVVEAYVMQKTGSRDIMANFEESDKILTIVDDATQLIYGDADSKEVKAYAKRTGISYKLLEQEIDKYRR